MAKQLRVYKWYLVLSIIISSINLASGIILYKPKFIAPVSLVLTPIIYAWVAFSIVMLIVFMRNRIEKVALWLPALYIFDQIFSFSIGRIAVSIADSKGLDFTAMLSNPLMVSLLLLIPVVTLIIAIKLFLRK